MTRPFTGAGGLKSELEWSEGVYRYPENTPNQSGGAIYQLSI